MAAEKTVFILDDYAVFTPPHPPIQKLCTHFFSICITEISKKFTSIIPQLVLLHSKPKICLFCQVCYIQLPFISKNVFKRLTGVWIENRKEANFSKMTFAYRSLYYLNYGLQLPYILDTLGFVVFQRNKWKSECMHIAHIALIMQNINAYAEKRSLF